MKNYFMRMIVCLSTIYSLSLGAGFAQSNSYTINYYDVDNEASYNLSKSSLQVDFDSGDGSLGDISLVLNGPVSEIRQNGVLKATVPGSVVNISQVYNAIGATPVKVLNYTSDHPTLSSYTTFNSLLVGSGVTLQQDPPAALTGGTNLISTSTDNGFVVSKGSITIDGKILSSVKKYTWEPNNSPWYSARSFTWSTVDLVLISGGTINGSGSYGQVNTPSFGAGGAIYVFADSITGVTPILQPSGAATNGGYPYTSANENATFYSFKGGTIDQNVDGKDNSWNRPISTPLPSNITIQAKTVKGTYTPGQSVGYGDEGYGRLSGSADIIGETIDCTVTQKDPPYSLKNNGNGYENLGGGYKTYYHYQTVVGSPIKLRGDNVQASLNGFKGEKRDIYSTDGQYHEFGGTYFVPRIYGNSVTIPSFSGQGSRIVGNAVIIGTYNGFSVQDSGLAVSCPKIAYSGNSFVDNGKRITYADACKQFIKGGRVEINGPISGASGKLQADQLSVNTSNTPTLPAYWYFQDKQNETNYDYPLGSGSTYPLTTAITANVFGANVIDLSPIVTKYSDVALSADVKVFKAKSTAGVLLEDWKEIYSDNVSLSGKPSVVDKTTAANVETTYYVAFKLKGSNVWLHNGYGASKNTSKGSSALDETPPVIDNFYYGASLVDKSNIYLDATVLDNSTRPEELRVSISRATPAMSYYSLSLSTESVGTRTAYQTDPGLPNQQLFNFKDLLKLPVDMGLNTFKVTYYDKSDNSISRIFRVTRVETLPETYDVLTHGMITSIKDTYTDTAIERMDKEKENAINNPYLASHDAVSIRLSTMDGVLYQTPVTYRLSINGGSFGDYQSLSEPAQILLDGSRPLNRAVFKFYDYYKNEIDVSRAIYIKNTSLVKNENAQDSSLTIPAIPLTEDGLSTFISKVHITYTTSDGTSSYKVLKYKGRYVIAVGSGLIKVNLNDLGAPLNSFSLDGVNFSNTYAKGEEVSLMLPKSGLNKVDIRPMNRSGGFGEITTFLIYVDESAPSIDVSSQQSGQTISKTGSKKFPTIFKITDDLSNSKNCQYSINGGSFESIGTGEIYLDVKSGKNKYLISVQDEMGNMNEFIFPITVWGK